MARSRGFRPRLWRAEPSLGIAWNLTSDSKTVLRAGYSRSYSPIPIYQGQWGTQGFTARETFLSPNTQLQPAVPLTTALPPPAYSLAGSAARRRQQHHRRSVDATDREPVYQSASSDHRARAARLDGAFRRRVLLRRPQSSGGRRRRQSERHFSRMPCAYRDQLNNLDFNSALRPYPQYQGFELYSFYPLGRYQRDAGYVRVEKRASMGLALSAYYEFSKQMDDYSGPYGVQDYYNRQNDWSLTSYNQPQRLQLSYSYELPARRQQTVSDLFRLAALSGGRLVAERHGVR